MSESAEVIETLSKRELEVAAAYAEGASYKEIARDLGISPTTVRSHLRTVYGKLNVTSKIALAQTLADPASTEPVANDNLASDLALELDEANRRERAMSRVLRIISESDASIEDVIDEVLDHALEICEAEFGILMEHHGDYTFTEMRSRNISPAFARWLSEQGAFNPGPETAVGRSARGLQPVSIADIGGEGISWEENPLRMATVEYGRARSLAAIPMTAGGRLIGVFSVYRTRVQPFNDRSLELAQAFADQAAIALENVRQFREVQGRLEREKASAEILQIISQSRDDEAPVFNAILRQAKKLCEAEVSVLLLANPERTAISYIGSYGQDHGKFEAGLTIPIDDPMGVTTAVRTCKIVHNANLKDDDLYRQGHPTRVRLVDEEGIHAQLAVPLMQNGQATGVIALNRREAKPFSAGEIALVESFAAQAVIAIENVRQFKALETLNAELNDRVQDQVGEIERMGRLKRFLPAAVADAVVTSGDESMLTSHGAMVATLFCDMRGFTAFCEAAEPEETIEVLQTYHQEMSDLIDEYGGGVDQRAGDGIMVIFNDPIPVDDPAGDAVRLAIAMRARMRELCAGWKRLGHRLGFGVGVSLGYATVGMVGSAGRFDYTASGTSVNTAARLCDMAADGEVLISPRVRVAVEGDFQAESRGEVEMKGIREPVEVFAVS